MQIVAFPLGPLETNCYLLHDDKERKPFSSMRAAIRLRS